MCRQTGGAAVRAPVGTSDSADRAVVFCPLSFPEPPLGEAQSNVAIQDRGVSASLMIFALWRTMERYVSAGPPGFDRASV